MPWFAGTVVVYASCPSEIINSGSFHLLSIRVWKINYVVVLFISLLISAIGASCGTRGAVGRVVEPGFGLKHF